MRTFHKVLFVFGAVILLLSGCVPAAKTPPSTLVPSITSTQIFVPTFTPTLQSPAAIPSATFTAVPPPEISHLTMIDALNGWASTSDVPFRLLFTHDGGETWKDITPGEYEPESAYFLNPQTGWVLKQISFPGHPESIYLGTLFTNDGAKSWTQYPTGQIWPNDTLHFSDPQHGWIVSSNSGGTQSAVFKMYQTIDGGRTWKTAKAIPPTPNPFWGPDAIFLQTGNDFYFDPDRIIILHSDINNIQPSGSLRFDITFDLGRTWMKQSIPLQGTYSHLSVTNTQVIFNDENGLLAVFLQDDPVYRKWIFYTTSDGGITWKLIPGELDIPINDWSWPYQFASLKDIYITCGNAICASHDGAHTWQKMPQNEVLVQTNDRRLESLDFVDASHGWIVVSNFNPNLEYTLYRTTDGGATWTQLHPTILPYTPPIVHVDTTIPTPTLIPTQTPANHSS